MGDLMTSTTSEAERSHRVNKLPAPEAGACRTAKGRPWGKGGHERKSDTVVVRGQRPKRTVPAEEHQESELSCVVPMKVGNSPPEDPLEGR